MIVCKLEMWPLGNETKKRPLGEIRIANVGGDRQIGHYSVALMKSEEYAKREGPGRTGKVINFRRLTLGPYDLLLRALVACIAGRSPVEARHVQPDHCHFAPPSSEEQVL